jgi:hypothetical protein
MKRRPIKFKKSKRMFTKHADKAHPKNLRGNPMRGGIRL